MVHVIRVSIAGHSIALERLGRVYLRYRETIPAAVQCFFKSVETNPSNHIAWYLLGTSFMCVCPAWRLIVCALSPYVCREMLHGYCSVRRRM